MVIGDVQKEPPHDDLVKLAGERVQEGAQRLYICHGLQITLNGYIIPDVVYICVSLKRHMHLQCTARG